jgi:hypothetical protein
MAVVPENLIRPCSRLVCVGAEASALVLPRTEIVAQPQETALGAYRPQAKAGGECRELASRAPCVAIVQAANVGDGDDAAALRRLDFARDGRVAVECQMRAAMVVIGEVRRKDAHQVSLAQHDDVGQTLAPDASYPALDVRRLPRRARRRVERKRLGELAADPRRRRVGGGVEMQDPSPVVGEEDKAVMDPEGRSRHGEEVARDQAASVVV